MKKLTVVFISDPGHGWVKISREKLIKLGIARKISSYSYQRAGWVFLEEDCDAALLIKTCELLKIKLVIKKKTPARNSSKIRNYQRFALTWTEQQELGTQITETNTYTG